MTADRAPAVRGDHASSALTQAAPLDRQRALTALGLDPRNPISHAALIVAETYGLDPALGHVQVIPGKGNQPAKIWISRDGYLFKAKQHPDWGGMELVEEDDGGGPPDGIYFCKVVVRRKGQPDQEGSARYRWTQRKANGDRYVDEHADEMCLQRAERRALRRQFPISLFGDQLAQVIADPDVPPADGPGPVETTVQRVREAEGGQRPQPEATPAASRRPVRAAQPATAHQPDPGLGEPPGPAPGEGDRDPWYDDTIPPPTEEPPR
jgi:hypothetical protein